MAKHRDILYFFEGGGELHLWNFVMHKINTPVLKVYFCLFFSKSIYFCGNYYYCWNIECFL